MTSQTLQISYLYVTDVREVCHIAFFSFVGTGLEFYCISDLHFALLIVYREPGGCESKISMFRKVELV